MEPNCWVFATVDISSYLSVCFFDSYQQERLLWNNADYRAYCLRGSVLHPILWNTIYNNAVKTLGVIGEGLKAGVSQPAAIAKRSPLIILKIIQECRTRLNSISRINTLSTQVLWRRVKLNLRCLSKKKDKFLSITNQSQQLELQKH